MGGKQGGKMKIKCPECGEFFDKEFLPAHRVMNHHPPLFRACPICGEKGHTLFHHSVEERSAGAVKDLRTGR